MNVAAAVGGLNPEIDAKLAARRLSDCDSPPLFCTAYLVTDK